MMNNCIFVVNLRPGSNTEYSDLKKLPNTMKYLTNMRHLYLDQGTILPAGIGGLTSLQTLRYFGVRDENDGCKIEELGGLNDLKGKLEVCNLERVHGKEEAVKANLFRKSKIMELGLRWDERREGEIENDENVLEGLQPHADLKKLSIRGFKGRRFPAWAMKMAVQNVPAGGSWIRLNKLTDIELGWCTECKEMPMLVHLLNLKSLKLEGLSNLKRINSSGIFPALERLVLRGMPKLAQVEFDCGSDAVQVFPSLRSLKIKECPHLMSVGTHSLPCLKYLSIGSLGSSMPAANLLFETKYGLLAELFLVGIDDLECLPDWFFRENPNLLKISILECPKLRELPPGLLTLTSSLQTLHIADCPLLERITCDDCGEESQSVGLGSSFFFTSLRSIYIKRCNALVWLPRELVGPSLEELRLESLSSLKNVPNLMDECMARSPRLNSLTVVGVPKFMLTSGFNASASSSHAGAVASSSGSTSSLFGVNPHSVSNSSAGGSSNFTTPSVFNFGLNASSSSGNAVGSTAPVSSSLGTDKATTGSFSSSPSPTFAFGAVGSTAAAAAPAPVFSFGGSSSGSASVVTTSFSSSSSTSAVASTSGAAPSTFSFGMSNPASSASGSTTSFSNGGFNFGGSSSASSTAINSDNARPNPFGSSLQAPTPSMFGSSPATGFSFGASAATSQPTNAAPVTFNSFFSAPASVFSSPSPSLSQPVFGNNFQMNGEDSMAEDPVQSTAPTPSLPAFGQPNASPSPPGFMFGSTTVQPQANPFQFGGQQNNQGAPQNPFVFQASGSLGGSFSLGSGGGDKSGRKFVKANRNKNRKK